ncbi:UDP-N-acetylmuramoyl-L-alanyl-D-glutamate--2,6-diaminopimelate ligase [Oceanobacter mangrovi]|uniref:UDP-N-acetylmuramoyl-L-alanyl-D-glutamate--2, 6-diaminopimelate ligase n=1 Tax=Oceanobacter mangrovi TaxID=2862510 RepID=UPI001C8EC75C|nr:UDP-N-acetylmuramoyl-L-alanyl-D-glutamate--2,6-diaminopimelate ligase [Oceanobacter mangrovi]
MKLSELIQGAFFVPPEWDREFSDIATDSRDVKDGDLFIGRAGGSSHGADFTLAAIANGAAVVIEQGEVGFRCDFSRAAIPVFSTPDVKEQLAGWLHRRYSAVADLKLLGVTGTNGKSSCVSYLAQLSAALQQPCGVLGTLGNGLWPELQPTRNTTPDLAVVLRVLAQMQQQGAGRAAMEVSSHGLEQGRVAGLVYDGVMLTNLTQDHLDFHGTMEAYFAAKVRLFTDYQARVGVVNADCPYGRQLLQRDDLSCQLFSYGRAETEFSASQHVSYAVTGLSQQGITAQLTSPWGTAELQLPLLGEFNLANAVGAITLLAACGEDFQQLVNAAAALIAVAGRMEVYVRADGKKGPLAVVDYAHTPDALATVLSSLKPWQRPLGLVFGCGGDRDRGKRPLMMAAALASADRIWLTDDNPRSEDPTQIFADVMTADGAAQAVAAKQLVQQHDRAEAIAAALAAAEENAIVLIAGKGHEDYQEINGVRRPFSDIEVLQGLGFVRAGGCHAV